MTYLSIKSPYNLFFDVDGTALEDGYIYIGQPNLNPLVNPLPIFWDKDGLYPAAQPIRTIGGYPSRNGSPSLVYIDMSSYDDYSILINDKHGDLVYSSLTYLSDSDPGSSFSVDVLNDLRSIPYGYKPIYIRGHSAVGDGGFGEFEYTDGAAPGTYVDDNGSIIVPTGGDGSAAWIRQTKDYYSVKDFGAVGDSNGSHLNGTDDSAAISAALTAHTKIMLPDGNYRISNKIDIINQGAYLFGGQASYAAGANTVIIPDNTIADYAIECSLTSAGIRLSNFEIDAAGETGLTGLIYLKDDGSSLNRANTIEHLRLRDVQTDGAEAIKVEAWGTTIDDVFIRSINRGYGIRIGAAGVSGTTQYLNRAYIGECDVCISVAATSLGVTIINPIIESAVVGIYVRSNHVAIYNLYMENMNRENDDKDGTFSSLVRSKVIGPDAGNGVDFAIYLDGGANAAIYGMYTGSLNDTNNSKFLGVAGGDSVCRIYDGKFNSSFNENHFEEVSLGRIELINPIGLNIESVKNSVSYIEYSTTSGEKIIIESGNIKSFGDSIYNDISRSLGDIHVITNPPSTASLSYIAGFSLSDVTTSDRLTGVNIIDITDATNVRVGDYIAVEQNDGTYLYSDIAVISTNQLTLTDNLTADSDTGSVAKIWRWAIQDFQRYESYSTSIAAAATDEIASQLYVGINWACTLKVIIYQANNIRNIYRLFIDNIAGAGVGNIVVTDYESGTIATPTFAVTYSGGYVDVDLTNNSGFTITVATKSIDMNRVS